jgi:hypothetical protein
MTTNMNLLHPSIDGFFGPYRCLSNFWAAPLTYNGVLYATVEHGYQSAKCVNSLDAYIVENARTPALSKNLVKKFKIREDWDDVKLEVMYDLVKLKFQTHEYLKEKLLDTGDVELIEGNTWGDTYWGVCNGVGENNLGHILMQIREELRVESDSPFYDEA